MHLKKTVTEYLEQEKKLEDISFSRLQELVSIIDLTTLSPTDSEETVSTLCNKATTFIGDVAAVCTYPPFVKLTSEQLASTSIKIVSVANFPSGQEDISSAIKEIEASRLAGANEIDVVFPYSLYLEGKTQQALNYIAECKKVMGTAILKVILEISEYPKLEDIYAISQKLIELGVNFIKTSTGKSKHGATLEGAAVMLLAIEEMSCESGFKASGGIKTVPQACAYYDLAKRIMGQEWVGPNHFRIGASSLLDDILSRANLLRFETTH